ncbi:MAG: hypothetical protein HY675_02890 [Chloroflexi bacterium]|nr:hypothetical protein [Chloroflexota bacterium]
MPESLNNPTVDFLILADRAEAVNGKLYMMGGGWDRLFVVDFGQPRSISVGVGILIPWNATNVNHTLSIRAETQDGDELAALTLNFKVGRPSVLGQGESQRIPLGLELPTRLPGPGTYVIKAFIDDIEQKHVVFYATLIPAPTAKMPPSG